MTVLVYRWRTHSRTATRLPHVVFDQLRLANNLWNDLVRIELDRDQAVRDVWSRYPEVARVEIVISDLDERAKDLASLVAEQRSIQRTRAPKHPAVAELREAKSHLRAARKERRDAIAAVLTRAGPELAEITSATRDAVKALYRVYTVQGMYWPVYNDVVDRWTVACQRIRSDRAKGRASTLRFHRFDGSGALTVQLQRGKDQPARTPARLSDREKSPWRNVFTAPWTDPDELDALPRGDRKRAGRQKVRMRIGSEQVEIPVQMMDRWLPADAEVTYARLVLERCAGHTDVYVDVTVKLPDPAPVADGPDCAVHIGWCQEDDASVRVATLAWDQHVPIPAALSEIVRAVDDATHIVVVPSGWIPGMQQHEHVKAERDKRMDEVRTLVSVIAGAVTEPDERLTHVNRWRSLARFGAQARRWRDDPPAGPDPQDLAMLEHWRAWDRRLWEAQEHGRRRHIRRRDDAWARVAAWISDVAGTVTVDDTSVAVLARRPDIADLEPIPESVTTGAWAGQRVDVAPGGFRSRVVQTCRRVGVPVTSVSSVDLTRTCRDCGHVEAVSPGPGVRSVQCTGCGTVRDVDVSAASLLLARGVTERSASTDRSTPAEQQKRSTLKGRRRRGQVDVGTAREPG